MIKTFQLKEIADWQISKNGSEIELPPLQRSFVWKANQIETLWDSILRGFPVGSFLLSQDENDKLFLIDGQQRATSIALGFFNHWEKTEDDNSKFWSLKNNNYIPSVWIDLAPNQNTLSQKFVIRVLTRSHPWGYQRIHNTNVLSVADRRNALEIFKPEPTIDNSSYFNLSPSQVFPYDSNIPVPLPFLLKSINDSGENWKDVLFKMCLHNLQCDSIRTKHNSDYKNSLQKTLKDNQTANSLIFSAVTNLKQIIIPGIVINKNVLKAEDEQPGEDPTLFVRLNSSGTRISGEELIYSIYKASFPEAKQLVEDISANFVPPSFVISLVSRLIISEINNDEYPAAINVNNFRQRILDPEFKEKLIQFIGVEPNSPAKKLFSSAFKILLSKDHFNIPPTLVKVLIKTSPELLLLLLQWIKINQNEVPTGDSKKILGAITALSWFCADTAKYVREIWKTISEEDFWSQKKLITTPLAKYMNPLISPESLRDYLQEAVIQKQEFVLWGEQRPDENCSIWKGVTNNVSVTTPEERNWIWDNFRQKLFWNKQLLLFAQRDYINTNFHDFNQMESLEDTNTPWDWDHIYPSSWVYYQQDVHESTRQWTWTIGNLRALALEINRSENNNISPKDRLHDEGIRHLSYVKANDWNYWNTIEKPIKGGNKEMIQNHLSAITTRLCNIYDQWYTTFAIDELFNYREVH